jgi:enoyl-CoA hydratase/carnithine racemase
MSKRVTVTIEDHVAEVVLDRPEKFNALDLDMFRELDAAGRRLSGEAGVRAVVLHGAGENFCAGIDLDMLHGGGREVVAALLGAVDDSPANLAQRAAYAWRELPMPVICAVHGLAFGGGLQIALGADVRIASPSAQLSVMESKWGIVPDMAITTTLARLVAPDVAMELAFSARVFGADEALHLGVVTRVDEDPLAAARAMAVAIAERSPDAIRGIKKLFNPAATLSEEDALALEAQIQASILGTANQAEAVRANLEKRKAKFVD